MEKRKFFKANFHQFDPTPAWKFSIVEQVIVNKVKLILIEYFYQKVIHFLRLSADSDETWQFFSSD